MRICKRGHKVEGENAIVRKTGYSICKACYKISRKRWEKANTDKMEKYKSTALPPNLNKQREYTERYKAKYPGRIKENHARFRKKNPEKVKEYQRKFKEKLKDPIAYKKERRTKSLYNLSSKELDVIALSQSYCCAICLKPTAKLLVDHNHITNKIRELLCHRCNVGLGLFLEDVNIMKAAIAYVEKHNGK